MLKPQEAGKSVLNLVGRIEVGKALPVIDRFDNNNYVAILTDELLIDCVM